MPAGKNCTAGTAAALRPGGPAINTYLGTEQNTRVARESETNGPIRREKEDVPVLAKISNIEKATGRLPEGARRRILIAGRNIRSKG
ncbi:hypothetical protein TWF506_004056 [Arthrobotrys conoides]|uniref:Uncharacterized protein n=1 Tax=Arthrobotrys conoides TaxID=74498 RepID=A0AAN8NGA0_9PEZI